MPSRGSNARWACRSLRTLRARKTLRTLRTGKTLRTLQTGEPQEAAWAARRAYDALDRHVTHRLNIDDEKPLQAIKELVPKLQEIVQEVGAFLDKKGK